MEDTNNVMAEVRTATGKVVEIKAATDGWAENKTTLGVIVSVAIEQEYVNPADNDTTATFIDTFFVPMMNAVPNVNDVVEIAMRWRADA